MREWHNSKKHVGVFWRDTVRGGKTFYITYYVAGRLKNERVGSEAEGYSAALAATIRANRVQASRHGKELPKPESSIPTFGAIAEKYLTWAATSKASAGDDTNNYKKHLAPRFANLKPAQIRQQDLEKLLADLQKKGYSPASTRHAIACFRAIWNKGRTWGHIEGESPTKLIKLPRLDNTRERALTESEAHKLLEALKVHSPATHGLALLAYNTGGRRSELFDLTWADVDLEGRNLIFRNTKNGSTRRVPLNENAAAYLIELKKSAEGKHVFIQPGGARVNYLSTAFQRTADKLFNPEGTDTRHRVVFHTLRHTFISRLVAGGVPLTVVKELVGHSSLAMLQRYSHLAPGAMRQAVELMK